MLETHERADIHALVLPGTIDERPSYIARYEEVYERYFHEGDQLWTSKSGTVPQHQFLGALIDEILEPGTLKERLAWLQTSDMARKNPDLPRSWRWQNGRNDNETVYARFELGGILLEAAVDPETARQHLRDLRQTSLYSIIQRQWCQSVTIGVGEMRRKPDAGSQLLDVIVAATLREHDAAERLARLKDGEWYKNGRWLVGEGLPPETYGQLLSIWAESFFVPDAARAKLAELRVSGFYNLEKGCWRLHEDDVSSGISLGCELLDILLQARLHQREQKSPDVVPDILTIHA